MDSGNELMNEIDDLFSNSSPAQGPPIQQQAPPPPNVTPKNVKDVLGDRIRTQMGAEKRKLEDSGNSDIMSKTQKMDHDLMMNPTGSSEDPIGSMNGGPGGPQRLLEQALMDKQPLKKDMNDHQMMNPNFKKMQKMNPNGPQRGPAPQGGPMMTPEMMENPNYYGIHGQQPQFQRPMQQQRPPMNNWNNMGPNMYNGQKMPMRHQGPPRGGGMFMDPNGGGGPPPNAWVQPNDPNKVMMGPNGPSPGYYNRNGAQRAPMMRPNMNEYSGPGGQMPPYGNGMPPQGGQRAYNDPYRFGSPNGVVQQPMYSPNSAPGNPDSMQALRMNATFQNDTNAGYNGYPMGSNGGSDFGSNHPHGPNVSHGMPGPNNGYNRMRPNFMPNNMMPYNNGGRLGMPQQQSNPMCHNGNMDMNPNFNPQQQQAHPNHLGTPQGAGPNNGPMEQFNSHVASPNTMINDNFNDFGTTPGGGVGGLNQPNQPISMNNNLMAADDWRPGAIGIRQSLLNKLKEALVSQNYPNSQSVAEAYEHDAFISATSLKEYQNKLVQWLASIYDTSSTVGANQPMSDVKSDVISSLSGLTSPPDSSTNGLSDVTTSSSTNQNTESKVLDQSSDLEATNGNATTGTSNNDDLLLATPKSEGCLSPTSPRSGVNSPNCNAITTSSTGSGTTTAVTSMASPVAPGVNPPNSSTTFQCPPAMPPISEPNGGTPNGPASTRPSTATTTAAVASNPQQRRISGSTPISGVSQNGGQAPGSNGQGMTSTPMSSIGNNPQSVDSGIGLGSPRSITSGSSSTLYSPKIQGTSPSLMPGSENSPEKATAS